MDRHQGNIQSLPLAGTPQMSCQSHTMYCTSTVQAENKDRVHLLSLWLYRVHVLVIFLPYQWRNHTMWLVNIEHLTLCYQPPEVIQLRILVWLWLKDFNLFCSFSLFVTKQEVWLPSSEQIVADFSMTRKPKKNNISFCCTVGPAELAVMVPSCWLLCEDPVLNLSSARLRCRKTEKKVWHKYVTETRGIIKYENKRDALSHWSSCCTFASSDCIKAPPKLPCMHHHTAITCTKAWNIVSERQDEKIFGFMEVKKQEDGGRHEEGNKKREERRSGTDTQKGKVWLCTGSKRLTARSENEICVCVIKYSA